MDTPRLILKPVMTALGFAVGLSVFLGFSAAPPGIAAAPGDWLTWGYDQERTGWNRSETVLTKDNVSQLKLKWKTLLSTAPRETVLSTLTAPLVATVNGPQGPVARVFTVGSDNTVYAVDPETGEISWQKRFPNTLTPPRAGDYRCPNTQNATPVIDREAGIIYVSTSDGKLRGLSLVNGEDRMPPTDFTNPFARNWSLNLIDGVIYSPTARGCADTPTHFTAMDLKDPARRRVEYFAGGNQGAWGRGGLVRGPKGIYFQTADGPYDPAAGKFGETVMVLNFKDLRIVDSYTPANWKYLNDKDLDLGSANPVIFPFQKWTLLASVGKESVISLLDADNLGGADHHTPLYQSPRWGNDEALLHDRGVWGAMATWQDGEGRRWLFMDMLGPASKEAPNFKYTYGSAEQGSIMAFEVRMDPDTSKPTLDPVWMSRDIHAPDVPVVANGVVYALQSGKNATESRTAARLPNMPEPNLILYAFDAGTGRQLYSSDKLIDSFTHFTEPVVAGGNVYVCTWDGKLYTFGLTKK
jgi:outer membrane protein assembly factor BamB